MKIALVSPQFPPIRGGIAEHVNCLANALSKKHDVTVFTMLPYDTKPAECYPVVPLVRAGSGVLNNLWELAVKTTAFSFKVSKALEMERFDIIHDHSYGCAFIKRPNTVATIHSTWWGERHGSIGQKTSLTEGALLSAYPALMFVEGALMRKYAHLIAVSRPLQRELMEHYHLPEDNITVIPNGIRASFFENVDGSGIRRELGIGDDEIMVLYLGRLSARKGIGLLLEAFRDLRREDKRLRLVICGRGDYEKHIRQFLAEHKLEREVTLIIDVQADKIRNYYAACDMFVLPSLYETFGIVLLEAMSQGKPVVATNIGGIPFVMGNTGIVVEPCVSEIAAAMKKLAADPGLRKRIGKEAREHSKKFTWESVADMAEKVYGQILAGQFRA